MTPLATALAALAALPPGLSATLDMFDYSGEVLAELQLWAHDHCYSIQPKLLPTGTTAWHMIVGGARVTVFDMRVPARTTADVEQMAVQP